MSAQPLSLVRGAWIVCAREFAAWFDSGVATASTVAALLLANSIYMNEFFLASRVDMGPFFARLPMLLVLFLPAQSMRLWAEERRTRTFEVLVTLPLRTGSLVLGKFAAALALYGLFLVGTLPIVVMLCVLGSPDLGLIASGYLAALLLGALLLAVGELLSALSPDQVVAFVLAALVSALLVLSGDERLVAILDGLFAGANVGTWIHDSFSVIPHYEELVDGVASAPALAYFVGLTALSLGLATTLVRRLRT
ncbi:MAG: ABC transporter permease [Planctomycetes bacterium]|nr:ABC transporter permease [Planctomycetota bacterium]